MPDPRNRRGRVEVGTITTGSDPVYDKLWEEEPNKDLPQQPPLPQEQSFNTDEFLRGLSTIGRQIGQGATMDFADEIGGVITQQLGPSGRQGLERVQRFVSGEEVSPEEALQRQMAAASLGYRDVQQAGQAQSEQDREERPYVSFASNVAGGLLAGRALGGATTGAVNRATQSVSNNLPALARPLRTAASAVRSNRLGRAASNVVGSSAVGAGYGAVGGLGASQGNLDTEEGRERMVEDAQSGATAGAILGGGLSTLGEGLNVAVPYVRRNISGLQGLQDDIPEELMEELMAPPSVGERGSISETLQRTANPQTVERRLNAKGGRVQRELIDATSNTAILPRASQEIATIAREGIDNLPTGIQPRLRRVLRNIEAEAKRYSGWNVWNNQSVRGLNSMIDELGMLAEQGSRDAAIVRQRIIDATRRGASDVVGEAQRHIRGIQNDPRGMNNVRSRIVGQLESIVENSMNIQDKQKLMDNIDTAIEALRRNVERQGGRANPLSLEQMIQRYAGYTIVGIPLSPRDLQKVVPAIGSILRAGISSIDNPGMGSLIGQSVAEDVSASIPQEEIQMMPEETGENEVMSEDLELQEIEEELRRREEQELQEIEAELERRRNQGRSLRSQRRRERLGR